MSWSEDTQTEWQTVLGRWWWAREQCVLEHWRFLLGLTASSPLGKGEGAPYIAKTYLSSYRQNDVMSRICFKITCKVRLKVKRDKMKGT